MITLAVPNRSPWTGIVFGGLVLGTLDLIFACTFWAAVRGIGPERILQAIAAGVQGKAAFEGGARSAALGAACHYFIAVAFVAAYYVVGARAPALFRRPLLYGLPYGLLLYGAMTFVVVPLSNAPQPTNVYPPWIAASIIMHAVFGVICAWSARRARQHG